MKGQILSHTTYTIEKGTRDIGILFYKGPKRQIMGQVAIHSEHTRNADISDTGSLKIANIPLHDRSNDRLGCQVILNTP